jgi:hypothetical protein
MTRLGEIALNSRQMWRARRQAASARPVCRSISIGAAKGRQQALERRQRIRLAAQAVEHDDELVPPDSADRVRLPRSTGQAQGHLGQHGVARGMTQIVVDRLEPAAPLRSRQ